MATLIKGGTVVVGHVVETADVLIEGEKIKAVGDLRGMSAERVMDADGLLVLPGGVDTHVHFNDEFMGTVSVHDYFTGTKAAVFGGTTSVIDFSNQPFGGELMRTISQKHEEAEGLALIDWGIHPSLTDSSERTLKGIAEVVAAGSPTIKCYMTYRQEGLLMEEPALRKILTALRDAGGMMLVHAEDNDMAEASIPQFLESGRTSPIYHAESKPIEVENKAVETCVRLVREIGGRLFVVHMTTAEGVRMIGDARAEGLPIIAETCTHYLMFTDEMLRREDGIKWILSPPLRDERAQEALWQGLADGRLSMVTSDDAAYSWEAKLMGKDRFDLCPNGIPGIEPRFQLLYSEGVAKGRISLPRFVELVSTTPARLFGMTGKGSLAPGMDADVVLLDPTKKWMMGQETSHMATDWASYEEIEITGKIEKVLARGELIVDGDELVADKGRGRYLHRTLDFTTRPGI